MVSLQKLRQSPKLVLIVAALCVPLLVLGGLFVNQSLKDITFTQKELAGSAYLRAAWSDLSTLYAYEGKTTAPAQTLDKPLTLEQTAEKYNAQLNLQSQYDDLQRTLDATGYPDRALPLGPSTEAAVNRTRQFITQIADASNLTLDPHIDTYYLMNATVTALPDVNLHSNAIVQKLMAADGQVSEQDKADINTEIILLKLVVTSTDTSIASAIRGNPDGRIAAAEIPVLNDFNRTEADFITRAQTLSAQVAAGHPLNPADINALRADHEALQKATGGLWLATINELDRILNARVGMDQAKLWGLLILAGLVALAALGLIVYLDLFMEHAQIKKLNATLLQSNTELERFAYICSHDMQEPVRMMNTYAGLLQETAGGKLDEDSERYVRYIRENAVRMQKMIRDILTFARVGREDIRQERVDCQSVARMVLSEFETQIKASGAVVTCNGLPAVTTNPTLISILYQNLISNALKFQDGSKTPEIRMSAVREGNMWRFEVQDNGIGMDPAHHARIFTLFQRLNRNEDYPGTGIGLSTCRKFIRLCGGDITFTSAEGEGTTFTFTLPAK